MRKAQKGRRGFPLLEKVLQAKDSQIIQIEDLIKATSDENIEQLAKNDISESAAKEFEEIAKPLAKESKKSASLKTRMAEQKPRQSQAKDQIHGSRRQLRQQRRFNSKTSRYSSLISHRQRFFLLFQLLGAYAFALEPTDQIPRRLKLKLGTGKFRVELRPSVMNGGRLRSQLLWDRCPHVRA